jgi:excisionase family DNA binding protein
MPFTRTKPQPSETMSKPEVIEYLGKSKRTVETFVAKGRLGVAYVAGPNGKTARFRRSEVEALKREIEMPTFRAAPVDERSRDGYQAISLVAPASAPRPVSSGDPLALLTAALTRFVPSAQATMPGPFVGLAEAVEKSGMPASWLLAQARAGVPWAVDVSGTPKRARWRFAIGSGK